MKMSIRNENECSLRSCAACRAAVSEDGRSLKESVALNGLNVSVAHSCCSCLAFNAYFQLVLWHVGKVTFCSMTGYVLKASYG